MGQPWERLAVRSTAADRLFNPQTVKENTVSKSESTSSVYRITEIIGTSESSLEDAAKHAVETASKTLRDLRVAEVKGQLDKGGYQIPEIASSGLLFYWIGRADGRWIFQEP